MALRTCTVSCEDSDGHQHSLEVTAETLYEAVAQALAAFRKSPAEMTLKTRLRSILGRQ